MIHPAHSKAQLIPTLVHLWQPNCNIRLLHIWLEDLLPFCFWDKIYISKILILFKKMIQSQT